MLITQLNPQEQQYISHYHSPLGPITLAATKTALTGLWFDGQKYDRATLPPQAQPKELAIFDQVSAWLDDYFQGLEPIVNFPLALNGSKFRMTVWETLLTIPYREVKTYKDISMIVAKQLGKTSMSFQAIGGAIGHNPISIIIPCHRVIGTNRSLTGYAGGIEKKIALLELEHIDTSSFIKP